MFEDIFTALHEKNREVKLMGVWGKDGLELERKDFSQEGEVNLDLAGAEVADVISKFQRLKPAPDKFFMRLQFHGYLLIVFPLTPEFFLMMVTSQDAIPGKLSFYVELHKDKLISAL